MFSVKVPRTLMFQNLKACVKLPESLATRDKHEEAETGEEQKPDVYGKPAAYMQVTQVKKAVIRAL